ncbi:hypothetical protein M2418_002842 [Rhizobium sp. BIGb0125]|nr:hypothetical protein [Rhizobium sp. BIGb0125]
MQFDDENFIHHSKKMPPIMKHQLWLNEPRFMQ